MNENTTADTEIERATSSVSAIIERLFLTYARALRALFRRRLGKGADTDDLIQEVYVRLLGADLKGIRNLEAYLFTVAGNLATEAGISQSRNRSSLRDVDDPVVQDELAVPPNVEAQLDADARERRLREALEDLSPRCQLVVLMHYRYGLNYEQIGTHLEISAHMVKKYVMKALAHCRRRMPEGG